MTNVILDFCASCGTLLPKGLGNTEDPECPNCGSSVRSIANRIQGEFTWSDARLFYSLGDEE